MEYLKLCIGIDVAQKELVSCYGGLDTTLKQHTFSRRTYDNTSKGFVALLKWVKSIPVDDTAIAPVFVMEATGVYHQKFAHWLHVQGQQVVIVMPNKISNFMKTINLKTITDGTSAEAICQFGLEKQLDYWTPADKVYTLLQQLTRERDQVVNERTTVKNQLHAIQSGSFVNEPTLKRLKQRRALLDKQEAAIKAEIHTVVTSNPQLNKDVELITSIPGVGELTAVTILGETNGFELIRNKRQLTSYAGLDVRVKQSGTSVKAKPRISKKGNKYLRKALYFPAFTTIRHCKLYNTTYNRLVEKSGIKMKAAVSIQRKILELSFILFKTRKPFDPLYQMKKEQLTQVSAPSESSLC